MPTDFRKLNNRKTKKGIITLGISFLLISLIANQIILPALAQSTTPQFNTFTPYTHTQQYNQDYYLLDVKNETKNTDWNFPVPADAGDILVFYLYYHNSANSTIAQNTTLRVALPSGQNISQIITGYLWADNASNATLSNPLNQSVQVNLSSPQKLEYIVGSAKWYPNQADWRTAAPTPFPNSQPESQLFGSGINLGSITGCWEFSGAIVFKAKVGNISNPPSYTYDLSVNKTVRNLTSGQSNYVENVNANGNDRLAFQIQIQNTGNAALNNVFVYDTLPSYLSYSYGSARLDGAYLADGLVAGGLNIGSIPSGNTKTITFEALVNSSAYGTNQTLTNYAYARADQVSERNDTATVYLNQSSGTGNLNISKTVRNMTTGTNMLSSVNANINDRVLFLIQITTPVNVSQIYNARVWDTLPSGLSYVQGSTRIDNAYTNDGLISGGITIGAMSANQSKSINFEATVNSYGGLQTMTNYAYASADNVGQQSSFAQVVTNITPAPTPTPYYNPSGFTKKVDNLTSPNGTQTDNTAYVNDTLKYTLSYTNNSSSAIYNVQLWDILPSSTTFLNADNNGYYNSSNNQVTWNMGSLSSGATAFVSYQVRVLNVSTDNNVIANSAAIKSDSFLFISSNEVRTTVIIPIVKGASIQAVTGGNDLARNTAAALMISLWGIFLIYLFTEYAPDWKNLKFKFVIWKIKLKEGAK